MKDTDRSCSECGRPLPSGTSEGRCPRCLLGFAASPAEDLRAGGEPGVLDHGAHLGSFEILDLIGRGGMGEVYRAHDKKLRRDVAIKVLPSAFSEDSGRLGRFKREARLLASLDHPNICAVYNLEEDDGTLFIVMPLIGGDTLAERIEGGMSIDEIVPIFAQIAEGLEAAHEQGIVHRDLKPANIKVTQDGKAKILDFGLGKTVESPQVASAESRTVAGKPPDSAGVSLEGVILGTPVYMSPEQARGKPTDKRTDIWAFGCCLYETLTGRLPFDGETISDILAKVLEGEPQWDHLPKDTPPRVREIVQKCLRKNAQERLRDIGDARIELRELVASSDRLAPAASPARRPSTLWKIASVILVLAFGAFVVRNYGERLTQSERDVSRDFEQAADRENYFEAFRISQENCALLSEDARLAQIFSRTTQTVSINSNEPNAEVFIDSYESVDNWLYLGQTPIPEIAVPRGPSRWRIEKEGFATLDLAKLDPIGNLDFVLTPEGTVPAGMVRIPPLEFRIALQGIEAVDPVRLGEFYMDIHEVTNSEFRRFVAEGGYDSREFWKVPFVDINGNSFTWEQAMDRFRDKTGRFGPAAWEVQYYPDGEDDFPVTGISWYEAAAYAEFRAKSLPSVYQWFAAGLGDVSTIKDSLIPLSNVGSGALKRVGTTLGISEFGVYDLAGNAEEWCWNASGNMRFRLGGAWVAFDSAYPDAPFNRSDTNGFRCMVYSDDPASQAGLMDEIVAALPSDEAVGDAFTEELFSIYRQRFDYDLLLIEPTVESTISTAENWTTQKVSYNAAYNDERIGATLFLPDHVDPPYQPILYFPGDGALSQGSIRAQFRECAFLVTSGRAVLFPVYKSPYERRDELTSVYRTMTHFYADHVTQWIRDARRSVDYLESRDDMDMSQLGYFGYSWGSTMARIILAVDTRFKAATLTVGGLSTIGRSFDDVNGNNYVPYIKIPVLMLNGRNDSIFPYETSQVPMFELLGTPPEHKKFISYEGHGHALPKTEVIRETLDWFDEYLGTI